MKLEFLSAAPASGTRTIDVVPAFEGADTPLPQESVDPELSSVIALAVAQERFDAALGKSLHVVLPKTAEPRRVVIVGAGTRSAWSARTAELWGAHAHNAAKGSASADIVLRLEGHDPEIAAAAAFGVRLASYRFDKYRTRKMPHSKPVITAATVITSDPARSSLAFERLSALADSIHFARDLVSEPANLLHPVEFADRIRELSGLGLKVEILGERQMRDLGMGALLGVGQGSAHESQLAIIRWLGAPPAVPPIAFIGKGVCFDSGGVNLKRSDHMEEMIIDMSGAAAVAGAMQALARRQARVNAIGVLGLVENMPDGKAQRPGDVITTLSGQTVEVINTDAEGRLVLADALWYCQNRFRPAAMIDLATLTGVIMSALGPDIAGLFSNDETLARNLLAAASASHEPLWRLPLPEEYEKDLESRVADVKNVGGQFGGAIAAALFLQKFVNGVPWAHIDMGMTVWKTKSKLPTLPDGATGYGVRLLDRLVADCYESPG